MGFYLELMETSNRAYQLGSCIVNPLENKLICNGSEQLLQPKFIELLACLVARYPEPITREELINHVWEGNFYVGEKALTNAIWHLRKAFKELDPEQTYIETLRKTGYRVLLKPEPIDTADKENPIGFSVTGAQIRQLFVALCVISLVVMYWLFSSPAKQTNTSFVLPLNSIESVTASPGREIYPSISNDQHYLVYSWRQLGKQNNLYLRDLHFPEHPAKQLTDSPFTEGRSVFSPDANTLYYYRTASDVCEIVKLSLINATSVVLGQCSNNYAPDLDISSDGKTLAYIADHTSESGDYVTRIKLLDLQAKQTKETVIPCNDDCGTVYESVSFSPDAQRVVVTRNVKNNQKALFLIDVKTGQSQRLTHDFVDIHGVDWHPSKEQLAFSAVEGGKRYGYFYDINNQTLINTQIAGMSSPNYSSDGSVYYHQWDLDKVITRLKIDEQVANSPFSMLSTNFSSLFPEYNQQQNKLLYVSNESGSSQLWIVNPDSSSRKQLTDFAHNTGEIRDPTWSADGRYILFSLYDNGSTRLYFYDFKVEQSQQIKLPFSHAVKPKFSADSQHILVSDGDYLYRYDLTGKSLGKAIEVPAQYGVETQTGDFLFTNSRHAIWIKHHDTGVEEMLVNDIKLARSYAWLLVAKNAYHEGRIYYYKERLGDYRISYYDLASKQHHDLIALPERAYSRSSGLTYIPNERWLVYTAYLSPEIEIKRLPAAYLPK